MARMFYTLDEAAAKLQKTRDELRQMAYSGQLQEFRDRDKLMFKREQVDLLASDSIEPVRSDEELGAGLLNDIFGDEKFPRYIEPARGNASKEPGEISIFEVEQPKIPQSSVDAFPEIPNDPDEKLQALSTSDSLALLKVLDMALALSIALSSQEGKALALLAKRTTVGQLDTIELTVQQTVLTFVNSLTVRQWERMKKMLVTGDGNALTENYAKGQLNEARDIVLYAMSRTDKPPKGDLRKISSIMPIVRGIFEVHSFVTKHELVNTELEKELDKTEGIASRIVN